MEDSRIEGLINQLTEITIMYEGEHSVRNKISSAVMPVIKELRKEKEMQCDLCNLSDAVYNWSTECDELKRNLRDISEILARTNTEQ